MSKKKTNKDKVKHFKVNFVQPPEVEIEAESLKEAQRIADELFAGEFQYTLEEIK